ncbi:ATP-binding cassette domain-containing protein [Candidatus Poribacteria bacterium]|nr:ATP-binding cassette domain-containing protein [Candidatus Poribacteria bacterium]
MSDALIMDRVTKSFGDVVAVDELSLRVPSGCIYGVLGPNGAGKTTALRMIVGILEPDSGSVSVLGLADAAAVRQRIGYLPEEKGLYKKMRVGAMVAYAGELKGMPKKAAHENAIHLLNVYGLGDWVTKRCEALSKGMSQKAMLLSTMIHDPDLVILDEPFSGLDPVNTEIMRDVIVNMRRQGKTVLFSTHVMEQAEQICDAIVLIHRGRKVLDGPLASVLDAGGTAVQLDYDGDGEPLKELRGVSRVNDAGKHAELILDSGTDPQDVLAQVVGKVRVRRFDLREPSLHEVFVRAVKEDASGE